MFPLLSWSSRGRTALSLSTRSRVTPQHERINNDGIRRVVCSAFSRSSNSTSIHATKISNDNNIKLSTRDRFRKTALFHRSSGNNNKGGLFSIPELKQPSDFTKCAMDAIRTCDGIRNDLKNYTTETSSTTITDERFILYQLDSISRIVCNVIDAAELCRSVHNHPEWRDQANHAFGYLSDYIAQLNADTNLYTALQQVVNSVTDKENFFTPEEQQFIKLLQSEFERNGIHLSDEKRAEVCEYQNHITTLETMFTQNIINDHHAFQVSMEPVQEVIPRHVLMNAQNSNENDDDDVCTIQTNQSDIINTLLKYSNHRSLRKDVYMEYNTACKENLLVLDALIKTRTELASLLDYPSYAHYFLHSNSSIVSTPDHVQLFLQQLQDQNAPSFQKDMTALHEIHIHMMGNNHDGNSVEPWDIPYYVEIAKASILQHHQQQAQQQQEGEIYMSPSNVVSKYLTIDSCLNGIQVLVERLFHIRMEETVVTKDEQWDFDANDKSTNNSSKIRRMEFYDNDNKLLGIMYLDLYKRPGKYNHAAHFTVRCGCRMDYETNEYQLPVVALVCNFSPGQTNLSHGEVETLFHELGHALHSLLSHTTFQHVSGTRTAMDFVEIPSHLIEHYVYDNNFLPILMGKQEDDNTVNSMIHRLNQSKQLFQSIEKQNQILYAKMDQELFGNNNPAGATTTTTELFGQLHQSMGIPYAQGTHWHSRFGHLVTYGAGYYSYLFAKKYADDIWTKLFATAASSSLDRQSGERLWKDLLIHGGSRDPSLLLQNLLGRY